MPLAKEKEPLSLEERQFLILALQEAKARGMELPKSAKTVFQKEKLIWPVASNGYFIKNNGTLYEPSENQAGFIHSTARFGLFYGSRGSGKSGSGAQKALFKIMNGESGAVINPDFENFKYSTWPEFRQWIPWSMIVPQKRHMSSEAWEPHQPFTLVFRNGVRVYCKGLKDPNSARGPNLNWLWYDEAGRDESGLGWKIAIASVRIGKDPQAWATATPKPMEHWMYKFFILKEIPKEAIEAFESLPDNDKILVEAFHGTIEQNKSHLDPAFYASILAAYPSGFLRTQEVEGNFANEGGKIGSRVWFEGGRDFIIDSREEKIYPRRILDTAPEHYIKKCRFWDLAGTEKKLATDDPDESVGTLAGSFFYVNEDKKKETNWCFEHQVGGYWKWDDLLKAIADTARHDGPYVTIVLEEEPGSGGKNQVQAIKNYLKTIPELKGYKVVGQKAREVGDRVMAANDWFGLAADGKIWIVKGSWNERFLGQLDGFTQVLHDDRVTSPSGAMAWLRPFKAWAKVPFLTA